MKRGSILILLIILSSQVLVANSSQLYDEMIDAHVKYSKLLAEDKATKSDYREYIAAKNRYIESTEDKEETPLYFLMITVFFGLLVFGAIEFMILGKNMKKRYGITFGIIAILIIILSGGAYYWQSWAIVAFASLIGYIIGRDIHKEKSMKQ